MIPIIIAGGTDPVATGVVSSLAKPGGNVTGVTIMNAELAGKRLEVLKETTPMFRVWLCYGTPPIRELP